MTIQGKVPFLFLWIGVSGLGWLLIPINTLNPNLKSYWEVANRGLVYAACGLMIGLVIGLGQFLVLKHSRVPSKTWFGMTLAGYTLAWPVGLAISTLIPAIAFALRGESFLPLRQPAAISFFPFPMDLVLGGWVVGVAQWFALRQILPHRNSRLAALWALGVWLSVGLGLFVALIGRSAPINIDSGTVFDATLAFERAKIGIISGLVTGLLVLFVLGQARPKAE